MSNEIFCFGSNLSGLHSGGSAREAVINYGAIFGEGIGHHGNSYAIPTLTAKFTKMELYDIGAHIDDFIEYAKAHPELTFNIVAIGCGIAGFTPEEIAPMFADAPDNCNLPKEFTDVLERMAA